MLQVGFRTWWTLGVAWIVWACFCDQGGVFGAFLGSTFWQPLKNLTFGVYLVHVMVIDLLCESSLVLPLVQHPRTAQWHFDASL